VTLLVFVLLLPIVVILVGTWAWHYQLRVLDLLTSPRRRDHLTEVWLARVAVTGVERAELLVARPEEQGSEQIAVALDIPSPAMATLQEWHDDRSRLLLIAPPGRNIVRFRCLDKPGTLTLRRVAT
jgi:hypothetical protein